MEFTGKTVEETVAAGLAEMGIKEEDAEIKIIEQPTKGLFGKLKGKAVIKIVKKENSEEETEKPEEKKKDKNLTEKDTIDTVKTAEFIQKILDIMDITAKTEIVESNVINLIAANSSEVIGFRGEVLDAIQTLAGAVANTGKKEYVKVVVDCENYRGRREETLIKLAKRLENKAVEMRREVVLEPMNPFERRIIHTALSESETVKTRSEGKEPARYVVIVPNDKDEFSRPYNAGRNIGNGNGRDRRARRGGRGFGGGKKFDKKGEGFIEKKRVAPSGFGTYIGNSLKEKE